MQLLLSSKQVKSFPQKATISFHSHNFNQLSSKIENGDDALHFYDCVKIHVQYIKLQTHHSSKNVVADSCAMF